MGETTRIYRVIDKARTRLRLQAALDGATKLSILASALAILTIYLERRELIGTGAAVAGFALCGALVLGGVVWGLTRRFTTAGVAQIVDRANGLADRLGTACDFEPKLRADTAAHDPETRALMEAAVADAIRHLPKADARAATPFKLPRDFEAASAFAAVALSLAMLYFPQPQLWGICRGEGPCIAVLDAQGRATHETPIDPVEIDEDDLLYSEDLLDELRETAQRTGDDHLEKFVNEVDELLDKAQNGDISKEQLLKELAKKEEEYMKGSDEDIDQTMADLKDTGKQLKKNKLTEELGKALEQGDLEKAKQEFEKLADKMEKGDISDKEMEKLAKTLERAAEKFDKKQDKRDKAMDKKIADAKKQIQRLEKQQDEAKNEDEKKQAKRRLEQKERELKQLEREKEKQEKSASKRRLKRLHRNLKNASKDMEKSQDQQSRRTQTSRRMKDLARDTGEVDGDRRKVQNQKKVASQMGDMKEALRRARKKGNGMRDKFGKNAKNRDFGNRARGGRGQRDAWKPGQGKGNQKGGKQPGGSQWGTEDGGNPMGAATPKSGDTQDESLTGLQGAKGESTRQTIITAAQKGFAARSYKRVYANYKTVIEEVMRTEKVPSGYKYYIKRYFQKIKPHAMD
jgi:hypothetical protein